MWETQVQEDPLKKEMATHSSILSWRTPWTEEPGGLQSMGLQESDTTQQLNHCYHTVSAACLNTDPIGINFIKDIYKFHIYKFYVQSSQSREASLVAQLIKNPPAMQGTPVQLLGWENPLEK